MFPVELFFPFLVAEIRNPDVWEQSGSLQNGPIQRSPRLFQRTHNVEKEYGTDTVGFVDSNMLVGIVKQDGFALFPVILLTTHHECTLFIAGDHRA